GKAASKHQLAKVLVEGQDDTLFPFGKFRPADVGRARRDLRGEQDVVPFAPQPGHDVSRNIFVRKDSRASRASLINRLIHRHDVGRVKHGGAKMFGFESRVLIEKSFVSHAGPDLLQNKLDRKTSSFENGLAQHHVLAFLNVILPFQGHENHSQRAVYFHSSYRMKDPCRASSQTVSPGVGSRSSGTGIENRQMVLEISSRWCKTE